MVTEFVIGEALKASISAIVRDIVSPKLVKFAESVELKADELLVPRREHYEEYLTRTYKKYSILNTLACCNSQMNLKDVYVPLTIVNMSDITRSKKSFKVSAYPDDLLRDFNKLLVIDTAGMGKSTLSKRIYLDVIENGHGIPVFVELRRLSSERTILTEIVEQFSSLKEQINQELLLRFIETGGFVFIFDGYDEISLKEKETVTRDLQSFVEKTSNGNSFIMTSRPESSLSCFGDFKSFSIKPLTKKEAYELIRNYDKKGDTAKLLINQLKERGDAGIDEFLQNPLLVSLLFVAFDYKQTIPLKKHIFYRQVYDAYYDSHDLSKGGGYSHIKRTSLMTDDFNRVLRAIGFLCLKESKTEFTKDEILHLLLEARNLCQNISFRESDMLDDLLTSVPFFMQDGNYYKWSHKSLQEYFAAQFIHLDAGEQKGKLLSRLAESEKAESYSNLLDLYYDIDTIGFKEFVVLPYLDSYLNFYRQQIPLVASLNGFDVADRIYAVYFKECYLYMDSTNFLKGDNADNIDMLQELLLKNTGSDEFTQISEHFNSKSSTRYVFYERRKHAFVVDKILCAHQPYLFEAKGKSDDPSCLKKLKKKEFYTIDLFTGDESPQVYSWITEHIIDSRYMNVPKIENFIAERNHIEKQIHNRRKVNLLLGL